MPKYNALMLGMRTWFLSLLFFGLILITVYQIEIPKPIIIYKTYYKFMKPDDGLYCHFLNAWDTLPVLVDSEVKRDDSIFFLETSCNSYLNGKVIMNGRQACAVESAALMNPNKTVYLLYSSPGAFYDEKTESDRLISNLLSYSNVKILHMDMDKFVEGSPVENLWKAGRIQKSRFVISHTSDILRHLVLWKFGGIYSDLDVIVIRSLDTLPKNFAGAEAQYQLAGGVLGFTSTGVGHQHVSECLQDLSDHFDGDGWGVNGPEIIQRLSKRLCKTNDVNSMINKTCQEFTVLPPTAFYSIYYPYWRHLFEIEKMDDVRQQTKDSYMIHVWNKLSHDTKIPLYSDNAYIDFARKFCPGTVTSLEDYF